MIIPNLTLARLPRRRTNQTDAQYARMIKRWANIQRIKRQLLERCLKES